MGAKKVLLVQPSMDEVYEGANLKDAVPHYPPLNLLTIAGSLLREKHLVSLLDFDVLGMKNQHDVLRRKLEEMQPDIIGFTFTSPIFSQAKGMAKAVKECNKDILIVAGGSHPSADPQGVLKDSDIDIVIYGEGDFAILEIINTSDYSTVPGIAFKKDGKIILNPKRPFIKDLDQLALPALELVNLQDYHVPRSFCRESPAVMIETSRGCAWGCTYCTKAVFGRNFRYKSPQRVVDEFKHMIKLGCKEIHVIDDMFTTSKERIKEICR